MKHYGPCFHCGAADSTSSTTRYFPDLKISFAHLCGILLPNAERTMHGWEEKRKEEGGSFKWVVNISVENLVRVDITEWCLFVAFAMVSAAILVFYQWEQTNYLEQICGNNKTMLKTNSKCTILIQHYPASRFAYMSIKKHFWILNYFAPLIYKWISVLSSSFCSTLNADQTCW